jgi:8-oxo-dGTP pyrophosphatase MutT (NUDIX family)
MVKTPALFLTKHRSMPNVTHPLYRHIPGNNDADLKSFAPLFIAGQQHGYLDPAVAAALADCPAVSKSGHGFALKHDSTFESRNADLKDILAFLIGKKIVPHERFELYGIARQFGEEPLALADRALMPILGLCATGIHCNGYVVSEEKIKLWVGRRSMDIFIEPGKLDHIVAGGQPHGLGLRENLLKEAQEEAGIPAALVAKAKPVGVIRYARTEPLGVRRDTLFIYDLDLPPDFTPRNTDGETSGFELMDTEKVRRIMETSDDFKFNVPLVLIDFFIRHGLIEADEPGYADLASGLHRPF